MRENAQVDSSTKLMVSMLQEARSKARHSFMLNVGSSSCAIAEYSIVLQQTAPISVQLLGTPYSGCSSTTPQNLRTHELGPGVTMETVPSNLGQIIYAVPSAEVNFESLSGTPLLQNEVQIMLRGIKGNAEKTVNVEVRRGYPELAIP